MAIDNAPTVEIIDESMREGMQIESASIPAEDKVKLLNALSRTGLRHIVAGSFVSPKWVPQMADVEEVLAGLEPVEGVHYSALALNARGVERREAFTPPLSPDTDPPMTMVHLCDVFVRRNTNRSRADEEAAVARRVERAVSAGVTEARVAVNAAWGSNWLGRFDQREREAALAFQIDQWRDAGVDVTGVWLGDPMAWNVPSQVAEQVASITERWPGIRTFHLHLHDARGTALTSAYMALHTLDVRHRLVLDTSIGGMGGCPYCGHGRLTRLIPTEDLVDLLHEEGIDTGIDLDALIDVAHLAEDVVGHELWGHLSKVGPRPRGRRLYPMDMPFIETPEEAQHFRLGPSAYEHARSPWKEPITSPRRDEIEASWSSDDGER